MNFYLLSIIAFGVFVAILYLKLSLLNIKECCIRRNMYVIK